MNFRVILVGSDQPDLEFLETNLHPFHLSCEVDLNVGCGVYADISVVICVVICNLNNSIQAEMVAALLGPKFANNSGMLRNKN
jgi:hypothetical protein